MEWFFPNPESSEAVLDEFLTEWEQLAAPAATDPDYYFTRARFRWHYRQLSPMIQPTADVNVDEKDVRTVLYGSSTLQVGSAYGSGPGRALRAAAAALEVCRQHQLGPAPAGPARHALLCIVSSHTAELEMDELTDITEHIQAHCGPAMEVIFGYGLEADFAGELQVGLLLGYGPPVKELPPHTPPPALLPEELFPAAVRLLSERPIINNGFLQHRLGTNYWRTRELLEELEEVGFVRQLPNGRYMVLRTDAAQ